MWYRPRALSAAARTTLASFASLAWFVVMPGLAGLLWFGGVGEGGPGLVPADHRPPIGAHVRLTLQDAEAGAAWAQIVDQLGPRLPQHRPLAAPPTSIQEPLLGSTTVTSSPCVSSPMTFRSPFFPAPFLRPGES